MCYNLIDKLEVNKTLSRNEFLLLLADLEKRSKKNYTIKNLKESEQLNIYELDTFEYLRKKAQMITNSNYGNKIYIRGLVEFTNYCKENCYYCGIRSGNTSVTRFRLTQKEILESCHNGYKLGFRTFVLQGGEDNYFTDEEMIKLVKVIKERFFDCALTLSIGVRTRQCYKLLREAGADRFLLRHETADSKHFQYLHPCNQSLQRRQQALWDLKDLGYTVGSGIMVGSPKQTIESISKDLEFLYELQPHMVGIGPFLPHINSKFKNSKPGNVTMTLSLISILRIMFPKALIPSTTALSTASEEGRILGFYHGANVVMPNLSPDNAKENYNLYNNKKTDGLEGANFLIKLNNYMKNYGFEIEIGRGDPLP